MSGVNERVGTLPYLKSERGQRNANVRPGPEPRGFLKFIIKSHKTKMLPAQSAHRNKTKRSRRKAQGNKSTEYHISDLTLRTPYSARDNIVSRSLSPTCPLDCLYGRRASCRCKNIVPEKNDELNGVGNSAVCAAKHPTRLCRGGESLRTKP